MVSLQWCCKREVTWCFKKKCYYTWRPHVLLALLSLLSHPFLLFRMECVFAWVIAVPTKCTSESGCCVLNWKHEHMSVRGKMASLRRSLHFGCPPSLANSGASQERAQPRDTEMDSLVLLFLLLFWRRVMPANFWPQLDSQLCFYASLSRQRITHTWSFRTAVSTKSE